ncbi:MAG: nucleoside recognition domain-containing protein [Oscillospiraceae bacterium]|nr:nucleoside recognition domain-containing protein [Oscillospiraceae bacterium]
MKIYKLCNVTPKIIVLFIFISAVTVALFAMPSVITEGAINGLIICADIIIPSLFPFTVLALFISKSGLAYYIGKIISPLSRILLRINGEAATAVLMSFIAGYPVGARLISELLNSKKISPNEAKRMLYYSVNAGPAFIVIAVGNGMLHSKTCGWVLLFSHIISSLIIGIVLARFDKSKPTCSFKSNVGNTSIADAFVNSTADASFAMFSICSWIVLFSAIIAVFTSLPLAENLQKYISYILEVTTGSAFAVQTGSLPLVSFVLGWAGFSVQFQVLSTCKDIKPKLFDFMLSRFAHGAISAAITAVTIHFMPGVVQVISNTHDIKFSSYSVAVPASLALMLLCITFLCFLKGEKFYKQNRPSV